MIAEGDVVRIEPGRAEPEPAAPVEHDAAHENAPADEAHPEDAR